MLGYAFMGKAHSRACRELLALDAPLRPRLVSVAGRNEEAVAAMAERFGYERWTTDWHDLVSDPGITLFDNGGPNSLHAEPTIAAAEAGKHVLCEKPLGRDADESYEIWQRVEATGVKHLCGFNYRFVPAVRLARELDRRRRARRDPALPRPLPPGLGRRPVARHLALPAGRGRLGRDRRPRHARRRPRSLPRRRGGERLRARPHVRARAAAWTTASRRPSSSRAAPSARSRRRGSRSAGATRSSGRSTAPRPRSPSTWRS